MNYNELPPPAAKVFIGRQPFYYTKKSGLSSRHRGAKKDGQYRIILSADTASEMRQLLSQKRR
jgi:hypothetical protein